MSPYLNVIGSSFVSSSATARNGQKCFAGADNNSELLTEISSHRYVVIWIVWLFTCRNRCD